MTIASATSRITYTGDGSTTAFAVPFYFSANADIVVILQDTLGNQTSQALGTNYTLTGATVSAGGTCTFITAPTTGWLITIYRDPSATQTTSYNNNDPFPAKSHENALDKLTTLVQRAKDLASRAIRLSDGEATISTVLSPPAGRKNRLLGFDNAGGIIYPTGVAVSVNTLPTSSILPQGRLTLQSGVPVPAADVTSQNVYYTPVTGKNISIYTGGLWSVSAFTVNSADQTGLTLALAGSANWAADSIHDVFAVIDSGTLKLATRLWDAGMYATVVQITNVTAGVSGTVGTAWTRPTSVFNGTVVQAGAVSANISPANAGLNNGLSQAWGAPKTLSRVILTAPTDHFILANAGPMSARTFGSNDGTNWFLLGIHWFNDAALGASYTFDVNTDNQIPYSNHRLVIDGLTGVQNIWVAQVQFFNTVAAANGRRLTLRDGVWVNDASMTARTTASTVITTNQYEGVYLGAIHIDTATAGQVTDSVTYQASATCGISNAYNRRKKVLRAGIRATSTSYTLTSQVFSPVQGSSTFSLQAFCGLAEDYVVAKLPRAVFFNAAAAAVSYEVAIGVDSTHDFSGVNASQNLDSTGQTLGICPVAHLTLPPYAGIHTLYALERTGSGAGTCSVFNEARETVLQAEFTY